jgi:hypothetical protein
MRERLQIWTRILVFGTLQVYDQERANEHCQGHCTLLIIHHSVYHVVFITRNLCSQRE